MATALFRNLNSSKNGNLLERGSSNESDEFDIEKARESLLALEEKVELRYNRWSFNLTDEIVVNVDECDEIGGKKVVVTLKIDTPENDCKFKKAESSIWDTIRCT